MAESCAPFQANPQSSPLDEGVTDSCSLLFSGLSIGEEAHIGWNLQTGKPAYPSACFSPARIFPSFSTTPGEGTSLFPVTSSTKLSARISSG